MNRLQCPLTGPPQKLASSFLTLPREGEFGGAEFGRDHCHRLATFACKRGRGQEASAPSISAYRRRAHQVGTQRGLSTSSPSLGRVEAEERGFGEGTSSMNRLQCPLTGPPQKLARSFLTLPAGG